MKHKMAKLRSTRREEEMERINTLKELKDDKAIRDEREAECLRKRKIRAEMITDENENEKRKENGNGKCQIKNS